MSKKKRYKKQQKAQELCPATDNIPAPFVFSGYGREDTREGKPPYALFAIAIEKYIHKNEIPKGNLTAADGDSFT